MASRKNLILITIIATILYTASWVLFGILLSSGNKTASTANNSTENNSHFSGTSSVTSSYINSSSETESDVNGDTSAENVSSDTNSSGDENTSSETPSTNVPTNPDTPSTPTVTKDFTVGMWYSKFELNFKGMNEQQFQSKINEMLDNAKSVNVTDVYFHVRPSADAYYDSKLFPFSASFGGNQGEYPGYDPLKYMVFAAHERGLKIHAWINPYRVANSTDLTKLADSNIAKKWLTDEDTANDRNVLTAGTGLYFNPAIPEVREYIISGVKEILDNYDVDGVQIDDYFYPTTDASFDSVEYNSYVSSVSDTALTLGDWRRNNVNALVSGIYSAVHQYNNVVFGISPSAHISTDKSDTNYTNKYADVALWMSQEGYCDYIAPQLYFGYEYSNSNFHFDVLLEKWSKMSRHSKLKVIIGLAPYKIDPNQHKNNDHDGTEWSDDKQILSKQVTDVFNGSCDGVALYSYSYVCTYNPAKEHKNNFVNTLNTLLGR